MNRHTKNDLSFNKVELDYHALLTTARVAYAHSLELVYKYHTELRDTQSSTWRYATAERLATETKYLAVVADTLSALEEGLRRENVEIVNKPEIEPEPAQP